MHEEDMKLMKEVEEILEKELRNEMNKVKTSGSFVPGQTKTLSEAVCLMLKMKEYEEWLEDQGMSEFSQRNASRMSYAEHSYGPTRSSVTGRFMASRGMDPYAPNNYMGMNYSNGYGSNSYDRGYSGHSTKDRMIARLEDMMGEVKNDYEAQLIRNTIASIQAQ